MSSKTYLYFSLVCPRTNSDVIVYVPLTSLNLRLVYAIFDHVTHTAIGERQRGFWPLGEYKTSTSNPLEPTNQPTEVQPKHYRF